MSLHWCNTRFGGNSSGWPALDSPLTMARWSVSRLWPHIAWQGAHVSMYSREDVRALITARLMDAFTPQSTSQSIQLKRYRLFLGGLQHPGQMRSCSVPPSFQRGMGMLGGAPRSLGSSRRDTSKTHIQQRVWPYVHGISTLLSCPCSVNVVLENYISLCWFPVCHS